MLQVDIPSCDYSEEVRGKIIEVFGADFGSPENENIQSRKLKYNLYFDFNDINKKLIFIEEMSDYFSVKTDKKFAALELQVENILSRVRSIKRNAKPSSESPVENCERTPGIDHQH